MRSPCKSNTWYVSNVLGFVIWTEIAALDNSTFKKAITEKNI